MTTTPGFIPPKLWHALLVDLGQDDTIHIEHTGARLVLMRPSRNDIVLANQHPVVVQVSALWGMLEHEAVGTVRVRDMLREHTVSSSFARFVRMGFHGDLSTLSFPSLGLTCALHDRDDASAYISTPTAFTAHVQVQRRAALEGWQAMDAFPETITTQVLARRAQLGPTQRTTNLCSEIMMGR